MDPAVSVFFVLLFSASQPKSLEYSLLFEFEWQGIFSGDLMAA